MEFNVAAGIFHPFATIKERKKEKKKERKKRSIVDQTP